MTKISLISLDVPLSLFNAKKCGGVAQSQADPEILDDDFPDVDDPQEFRKTINPKLDLE